jgi:aspartyl-tRNA(Asn)/glutamyl-tRNA(Gln) amidotransferase subunit A
LNFENLTLAKAIKALRSKEVTPVELTEHFTKVIQEDNKRSDKLNAVVGDYSERAKEMAKQIKPDSLLSGAPVLIKDNMNLTGAPVNCGSKILQGYISPYTGGAVANLEKNGGLVYGSTNMDEFAMGSSSETSAHGITRNPVNRDYIPGGSSGGAAAAVAGGQAIAALGSDTGGSIRQPAAACGVVGLKPTYGLVSRFGLVAYASSLDQIGPIAKTVEDTAILLNSIAGFDERDSTSANRPVVDFTKSLGTSIKGKKIGIPKEYFTKDLDPEINAALEKVIAFYKKEGAEMVEVHLPSAEYAIGTYYILATAEASANLARFDGVRYGRRSTAAKDLKDVYFKSRSEGFGMEVKRRILLGTFVLSSGYYDAYYVRAQKVRRIIKFDFDAAFTKVDAILTPMMPEKLFKIGEKSSDPIKMYLSDIYTVSVNLAGLPAISIPAGKDSSGLPIGFQLIAPPFEESRLFSLGQAFDKTRGV